MDDTWNILVVDDEPDVHRVTDLTFKRLKWRDKGFSLFDAYSAKEARKLLTKQYGPELHVAIVDVVMDTQSAGLDLCRFIRENSPRSLRIVLRTGQPGVAPEKVVLDEYDIDYYLAKSEASPEKLYSIVRTCVNASQEISTLLHLRRQLNNYILTFNDEGSIDDQMRVMKQGLSFLERKHRAEIVFVNGLQMAASGESPPEMGSWSKSADSVDRERLAAAIRQSYAKERDSFLATGIGRLHTGSEAGLGDDEFILLSTAFEPQNAPEGVWKSIRASFAKLTGRSEASVVPKEPVYAAAVIRISPERTRHRDMNDLLPDLRLFMENWRVSFTVLCLQGALMR